jgi:hypothetical protein
MVVTFDAVGAPGYEIATKRYNASQESFDQIRVTRKELEDAIVGCEGTESLMISDRDIAKIFNERHVKCGNTMVTGVGGKQSLYDANGNLFSGAALVYNRR